MKGETRERRRGGEEEKEVERRSAFGAPDSLAVSPFQRFSDVVRASSFEMWMSLAECNLYVASLAVDTLPKTDKSVRRRVDCAVGVV